jgi:hypothetical protein
LSEDWHQLLEGGLVGTVLLVLSLGAEVESSDQVFEIFALSVHSLENMLVDEILVVELGDFLLWIKLKIFEFVP